MKKSPYEEKWFMHLSGFQISLFCTDSILFLHAIYVCYTDHCCEQPCSGWLRYSFLPAGCSRAADRLATAPLFRGTTMVSMPKIPGDVLDGSDGIVGIGKQGI